VIFKVRILDWLPGTWETQRWSTTLEEVQYSVCHYSSFYYQMMEAL
jgi:hypothetical protein